MDEQTLNVDSDSLRSAAKNLYYRKNLGAFWKNELKIQTKGVGSSIVPLYPNPAQVPLLAAMEKQLRERKWIRQIWFKPRQPGGSTAASATLSWLTYLFPNVYTFVLAQDRSTVERLFGMYETYYNNLSSDVRPIRQYFTKGTELVLANPTPDPNEKAANPGLQSRILVGEAKNINVGTGFTIHGLQLSEVARYSDVSSIDESLIPALSDFPGTVQIIESTAHYAAGGAWFKQQCEMAMKGQSDYEYHFLKWWELPEYSVPLERGEKLRLDVEERQLVKKYRLRPDQIKWRRNMIRKMKGNINAFIMSYPMNFEEAWVSMIQSSLVFSRQRLLELESMIRPPRWRYEIMDGRLVEHPEGKLWVWKKPILGRFYDAGGDVASGSEDGNYSVVEVLERGSLEQCAEWRGRILPRRFGDIMATIGRHYQNAQVAPELNVGNGTLERLQELNYPNIHIWRKRDEIVPVFTKKRAWVTTHESKENIVGLAREKIWERQIKIYSQVLLTEMKNFVVDYTEGGTEKWKAATGFDDCVMAWMITVRISEDENIGGYMVQGPKEEKKPLPDPAYYDADWAKIMAGTDGRNSITGPWAD